MMIPGLFTYIKWVAIYFVMVFLWGCSSSVDPKGMELELYPVTATLTLDIRQYEGAKQAIVTFVQTHKEQLLFAKVELNASSKSAAKLTQFARKQLTKVGVDPINISVKQSHTDQSHFLIQFTEYIVKTERCEPTSIWSISSMKNNYGCYVEGNRWQTMTNPERSAGINE